MGVVVVMVVVRTVFFPCHTADAPNQGGRTPGSQTPGVPATPSPRQPTAVGSSRAEEMGTHVPPGRSAKKDSKMRRKSRQTKCALNNVQISMCELRRDLHNGIRVRLHAEEA